MIRAIPKHGPKHIETATAEAVVSFPGQFTQQDPMADDVHFDALMVALSEGSGAVPDNLESQILFLLKQCWPDLDGNAVTKMEDYKTDRATNLCWHPPILSFDIERHGAVVRGSKRAEIQIWEVNLAARSAQVAGDRWVMIVPTAARLDVHSIARQIRQTVEERAESEVVSWRGPNEVWVKVSAAIPGDGPKQTVAGRRRRLLSAVIDELETAGWTLLPGRGAYTKFTRKS